MSHSLFSHYIIMQQTNKDLLMQEIHCIPSCTFPPLLTCWYYRFNCTFLSEGFFAVIKTFLLTVMSSGRPFGTSTALSFTCTLPLVTNWMTEELSCELGQCTVFELYVTIVRNWTFEALTGVSPSLGFQCWAGVLYRCLKLHLLAVGPGCRRLSYRLSQAGRSPDKTDTCEDEEEREGSQRGRKNVGEERMCDKQMLYC